MSSFSQAHSDDLEFPDGLAGAGKRADGRQIEPARELVNRARGGDRAAFAEIVLAYQDRLYNSVLRLVGDHDEARELTQEAFAKALEKIATFRGESGAYTWLFRIATNLAISQLRKVKRQRTFSLDRPDSPAAERQGDQASSLIDRLAAKNQVTPVDALVQQEKNQQVLAALGRLDVEYRAVLVMRDIEEMDYAEIAEVIGVPLGTLKSRLFRARLALRDELKGYA